MTTYLSDKEQKGRRVTSTPVNNLQPSSQLPSAQSVQRAQLDPQRLTPADVGALQRSMGNAAVASLLSNRQAAPTSAAPTIQRKLTVGPADDTFEREADSIAQSVQRSADTSVEDAKKRAGGTVQRDPIGPEGGALESNLESRLRQTQSSGSSLPQNVRGKIEPKLGADLGGVKVHTDSAAVQLSQEMGAKAFTHKNHIYYGKGHSPNDVKLTAHEAVHTVQQGAVPQRKVEDEV